jgi:hypothetical protein
LDLFCPFLKFHLFQVISDIVFPSGLRLSYWSTCKWIPFENFEISTGEKQGDPLLATLFSIVIDYILKQLELRGNISTRLKQCSAYADDIIITARNKQTLVDTFERLKNISSQLGLIVNENKTKYMKCTRKETQTD